MSTTGTIVTPFGQVADNVVLLEKSTVEPICEGFNTALASFQALFLQYQKHHFVVEGAEFYQLHEYFEHSYDEVKGHVHDIGERMNGLGGVPAASFSKLAELCCRHSRTRRCIRLSSNGGERSQCRASDSSSSTSQHLSG